MTAPCELYWQRGNLGGIKQQYSVHGLFCPKWSSASEVLTRWTLAQLQAKWHNTYHMSNLYMIVGYKQNMITSTTYIIQLGKTGLIRIFIIRVHQAHLSFGPITKNAPQPSPSSFRSADTMTITRNRWCRLISVYLLRGFSISINIMTRNFCLDRSPVYPRPCTITNRSPSLQIPKSRPLDISWWIAPVYTPSTWAFTCIYTCSPPLHR